MTEHSALSSIVPTDLGRRAVLLVALCVVVGAVGAPGVVAAQDEEPEQVPAAYYGSVTVDGQDASAGVEVRAVVDGEVADSITTDADGSFGGPSAADDKLVVHGEAGDDVSFEVSADDGSIEGGTDTLAWESGANHELVLAVDRADDGDDGDDTVDISPPDPGSADVTAAEIVLDEDTVAPGDSLGLTAVVANDGDGSGVVDVVVRVDGDRRLSEQIVVAAEDERELDYDVDTADLSAGDHDVTLAVDGDTVVESFAVEESGGSEDDEDPDESPDDDADDDQQDEEDADDEQEAADDGDGDSIPGFGVGAGLVALLTAGALRRSR